MIKTKVIKTGQQVLENTRRILQNKCIKQNLITNCLILQGSLVVAENNKLEQEETKKKNHLLSIYKKKIFKNLIKKINKQITEENVIKLLRRIIDTTE